jgi:hypothetical protein
MAAMTRQPAAFPGRYGRAQKAFPGIDSGSEGSTYLDGPEHSFKKDGEVIAE